jgi:hypothetical protein
MFRRAPHTLQVHESGSRIDERGEAAATGAHTEQPDRQLRTDAHALRHAAAGLCGLHRLRSLPGLHRGADRPAGPAVVRQYAHGGLLYRPADHGPARRGTADHPRGAGRRARRQDHLLRLRRDSRDQPAHRYPQSAPAAGSRPPPRTCGANPRGPAPGRLRRPLRASLERTAVARIHRRRRSHPAGCRGRHRPRRARRRADAVRRPAAAHRCLLRRLQRHGHPQRRGGDHAAAQGCRRPRLLGLRGGRALRAYRHERRAGADRRRVPVPAQVRRWAGHTRRAGGQGRAPDQQRPGGGGRRYGRLRLTEGPSLSR